MNDAREVAEVLRRILHLRLYPAGVKFCREAEELGKGEITTERLAFCQMVRAASQGKWQLSCPKDRMGCFTAQLIFGFRPQEEKDLHHHMKQFTDNREIAQSIIAAKPKLGLGEIEGLLVGPLGGFEQDLVILTVDSAQALPLIEAYGAATGKDLSFRNGTSSAVCSYGAVVSHQTGEPNLSIPCVGAKRYGLFQDYEVVFTAPFGTVRTLSDALLGFEKTSRLHFPILNGFLPPTRPVDYLLEKQK